jgi:hypothetical protein
VLPASYLTDPKPGHAFVYVSTIQRMTINLFGRQVAFGLGDEELDEDAEHLDIPIHAFDMVIADECHRGYPYRRAESSIRFFHLNHPGIVDQRKALCSLIRRRVGEADGYFKKYHSDGDATALAAFAHALRDLKDRLAAKEPYSAAARAMLMGLRGTHQVVDTILAIG